MLRLCRRDNMGVRNLVPALMLRLGQDQECYDFVTWWATCDPGDGTYDSDDLDHPYLSLRNANAFESVEYLFDGWPELTHVAAITLLKIKLFLDLKDLQLFSILHSTDGVASLPQEIRDNIKNHIPKSSVIASSSELMGLENYTFEIARVARQVNQLYEWVKKANKYYWPAILEPGRHLTARPGTRGPGSVEEMQLKLQFSYDSWNEAPETIEVIKSELRSMTKQLQEISKASAEDFEGDVM